MAQLRRDQVKVGDQGHRDFAGLGQNILRDGEKVERELVVAMEAAKEAAA